jgi:hypothetical protein
MTIGERPLHDQEENEISETDEAETYQENRKTFHADKI